MPLRPSSSPAEAAAATFAVVVGVETYRISKRWTLPGPARDAVAFAQWLRRHGVPPDQIQLLISTADDVVPRDFDVRVQPASLANVRDVVTSLADAAGGRNEARLLLLWGGHGVMRADNQRRLFCDDLTARDAQVINVDSMLHMLRTGRRGVFRRQLLLFDVCANYFEQQQLNVTLVDSAFEETGAPSQYVEQVALFAAVSGQAAKNATVRRTGEFSSTVRHFLDGPGDEFPPDADALFDHVTAHFMRLKERGVLEQTPGRLVAVGGRRGDTRIGDIPAPEATRRAAGRAGVSVRVLRRVAELLLSHGLFTDVAARDRLAALVPVPQGLVLQRVPTDAAEDLAAILAVSCGSNRELDDLADAIRSIEAHWASVQAARLGIEHLRAVVALAPHLAGDVLGLRDLGRLYVRSAARVLPRATAVDQMLYELQQLREGRIPGVPPIVEFAERVARALVQTDDERAVREAAHLREWVAANTSDAERLDLCRALTEEAARPPARLAYLLIDVGRHPEDPLEFWVISGDAARDRHDRCRRPESRPAIIQAVADLVNEVADATPGTLHVELFVPEEWLDADADQWPLETSGATISRLGAEFVVALRWRERAHRLRPAAFRRWRNIACAIRDSQPTQALWLNAADAAQAVELRLTNPPAAFACVGFDFVPVDTAKSTPSTQLMAALAGGMPYAVWLRQPLSKWEAFRDGIENVLQAGALDDLPHRLQQFRAIAPSTPELAPIVENLTVFWDDPGRNPLNEQLTPL